MTAILTLDEAEALPDPADCRNPGTKWGRIGAGRDYCGCARHLAIRRMVRRQQQRKHRGSAMPDGRGAGWHVGVNALPFWPLEERLRRAGVWLGGASAARQLEADADHPYADELNTIRRGYDRGWLTLHEVDRVCIRVLRVHPALVYGQAWHDLETGESL